MSNAGRIDSFDSELIRAFLNSDSASSQSKPFGQDAIQSVREIINNKILQNAYSENSPESVNDKISSQLLILLNKLELTSEIINQLKDNLSDLSDKDIKTLLKLNVLKDSDFEKPEVTIKKLKDFDFDVILKEITNAREISLKNPDLTLKDKNKLEELEKIIKDLYKELVRRGASDSNTESPESTSIPEKKSFTTPEIKNIPNKNLNDLPEKIKQFEIALDKLSFGPETGKIYNSTIKLFEFLNNAGGLRKYDAGDDSKLKALVAQQISQLENIEHSVKKLLISSSSESQLSTLINVLDKIDIDKLPVNNEMQEKFKHLILDLKNTLKEQIKNTSPEAEIREFLFKILDRIYKDFDLEPAEIRIGKGKESEELNKYLKPAQITQLKLIEAQIKLIMSAPDGSLIEQVKSEGGELGLKFKSTDLLQLNKLLEATEKNNIFDNTGIKETIVKLKAEIDDILKNSNNKEAAEKAIRKLFVQFTSDAKIPEMLQKSDDFHKSQLDLKQFDQLRLITDLIKQVTKDLVINSFNQEYNPSSEKIKQLPSYKLLIQTLQRLDQSVPDPANQTESELVELAGNLLDKLEKVKMNTPAKMQEVLGKVLGSLEAKLKPSSSSNIKDSFVQMKEASLRSLENLATSQDLFNKLNPAMQNIGEPMLFFVPYIINNQLSKLEIQLGVKEFNHENKGKNKKRRFYNQVKFKITFPHLGEVEVSLMHSEDEAFILFNFYEPQISASIEGCFPGLYSQLSAMGFTRINISCTGSSRSKKESKNWLSVVLNNL